MPNIYRVRAVSTGWTGAPGLTTCYFRQGSGLLAGDQGDAQLCADRVHAAFTDASGLFPFQWQVQVDATVDYIDDATGDLVDSFVVTPPTLIGGQNGDAYAPIAVMALLQLRTSEVVDGRRLRGRLYLGPLAAAGDGNGTPTAEQLILVVDMGEALLDAGVAGPGLVIWHRPRLADAAATPPVAARAGASAFVVAVTSPDYFAVLRSRRD